MRIKGLDFLRGIAIILVLFRHSMPSTILQYVGWVGVDLFFVLSGFLVSGLIFKEYLSQHHVDMNRFLIRRAFKIFPPFYFFIITCVILKFLLKQEFYDPKLLLSEIFYLQSYLPNIWLHTWTLAVEEHFYIVLSLFSIWIIKSNKITNRKLVIGLLTGIYILSFLMRFQVSYDHRDINPYNFFQSHLRMDGLIIGAILSYLYYFSDLQMLFEKHKKLIGWLALMLISPVFVFSGGSFFMNAIGISMINIGFALLILFAIQKNFLQSIHRIAPLKIIYNWICFIGVASYSIYIWHLIAQRISSYFTFSHNVLSISFYLLISIGIGIFFYLIIEKPMLTIRNSLYKSPHAVL